MCRITPVQIPVFDNLYYKNAPGNENATWIFQVKNGDELHIYVTKTDNTEPQPKREGCNPLGLDWGRVNSAICKTCDF